MKRVLLYILIGVLTTGTLSAQDYYRETMERVENATPYQALYILWEYLQTFPKFAPTCYEMGVRNQALVPTIHPIREYNDLCQCLYRTRLYLGNCRHNAKDQTPRVRYYPDVPHAGKNLTYDELCLFLNNRIDSAARTQARADTLYHTYCRLQNRYLRCNQMFTQFVEQYPREKNAHLLLDDSGRLLLNRLAAAADSLPNDIRLYKQALQAYPIEGYHPVFQKLPITLYRLDGLTTCSLLENDIPLWDYAAWVRRFLQEQTGIYAALLTDIDKAHRHDTLIDDVLLNRMERIDYHSFMHPRMWLEQQEKMLHHTGRTTQVGSGILSGDELQEQLERQYEYYLIGQEAPRKVAEVSERISDNEWRKYSSITALWQEPDTNTFLIRTREYAAAIEQHYRTSSADIFERIRPTISTFQNYTNELTGNTITISDLPETCGRSIINILPVGANYLVVTPNDIFLLNNGLDIIEHTALNEKYAPVESAYKVTSNTIALIQSDYILFMDNKGRIK